MDMIEVGDVSLRPEAIGDLSFATSLYHEQRAAELAGVPWPAATKHAFLDDQFRLQSAHYARNHPFADRWIISRADRAIGRLYIDRTAAWWRLLEIALVAGERGVGRGTALVGWIIDGATAAAAMGIELHVTHDNIDAARLYDRLGFVRDTAPGATHIRMRRAR